MTVKGQGVHCDVIKGNRWNFEFRIYFLNSGFQNT